MSPMIITSTEEELLARRAEIENALGISAEELRERARTSTLGLELDSALDELDAIDFRLGK